MKSLAIKQKARDAAEAAGLRCEDAEEEEGNEGDNDDDDDAPPPAAAAGDSPPGVPARRRPQYTFRGWHPVSRALLAHGHGNLFPAFLTYRRAVDTLLIDMLRPLAEAGVRPERFSSMLLEIASKHHTRLAIRREHELRRLRLLDVGAEGEILSDFGDKRRYAGCVPTGRYFADVLKAFSRTTRDFMDAEVKKRSCTDLKWDASYKEAKHLAQHHGQGIFKALVTGTNTLGEVRVQFHVVSDAHEQFVTQIAALLHSLKEYGQSPPRRFGTDKPAEDKAFFLQHIPSLQAEQDRLDALTANGEPPPEPVIDENACTIDVDEHVRVASTSGEINRLVDLVRAQLEVGDASLRTLALDAEWEVEKNAAGFQIGRGRLDLIQIGYRLEVGLAHCPVPALLSPLGLYAGCRWMTDCVCSRLSSVAAGGWCEQGVVAACEQAEEPA